MEYLQKITVEFTLEEVKIIEIEEASSLDFIQQRSWENLFELSFSPIKYERNDDDSILRIYNGGFVKMKLKNLACLGISYGKSDRIVFI